MLGVSADGLIDRLFAGSSLDQEMVDAVAAARRAGSPYRLISNSWGTRRYDRKLLAELFDGIVISGEEGMRKPDPRMYELGAERIGVEPPACVFVDDLPFNLDAGRGARDGDDSPRQRRRRRSRSSSGCWRCRCSPPARTRRRTGSATRPAQSPLTWTPSRRAKSYIRSKYRDVSRAGVLYACE